jgi:hypothetical protein
MLERNPSFVVAHRWLVHPDTMPPRGEALLLMFTVRTSTNIRREQSYKARTHHGMKKLPRRSSQLGTTGWAFHLFLGGMFFGHGLQLFQRLGHGCFDIITSGSITIVVSK